MLSLPPDVQITRPGRDVPAEFAQFSGGWGNAAWNGVWPTALVIEHVSPDGTVAALYAVGDCPQYGARAQCARAMGAVANGWLILRLQNGNTVEYNLGTDGQLVGCYRAPGWARSWAWLQRVPGGAAHIAATLAQPMRPPWEDIRIPVCSTLASSSGQTFLLQSFLYRTALPGRQPLVILNHGSTDGERPGVPAVTPFEAQARTFLAQGWNVLAFMRKGRGLSEGPMLEGSERDEGAAQVRSGLEDLDAAVAHMRAQAWVDPARIVIAGQSRGGMLSVAYAGHFPSRIAGVLNFAGGWWSEDWDAAGFNQSTAAQAGASGATPMLWLYGDQDPYYGLPFMRGIFEAFKAAGGRGSMLEFSNVPGGGHALIESLDLWKADVVGFLDKVASG